MGVMRCYRCLGWILAVQAVMVAAPCGCEQGYCQECLPDLSSWLKFLAARCLGPSDSALDLAA